MTRLSASNLELIRTRPQSTRLYMSIFQPQVVFRARVNDASISKGARVITYNNVTFGSYTALENGMTVWIGSTSGGMELGKIRFRSATSTELTLSENSNVNWQNGAYITIFRYFELWPVYPRIILNPNNNDDVIFYKDWDIAYDDQNSKLGTYINMGPHRAANLDPASGQARIYYSSSGTYNLLEHALTYSWFFEGATVTGSSSADPGYITYNTPGHYVTRLTTTDSVNGATDVSYRYVSIYNPANPSIRKWTLNSLQGSRDEGGYTASFKIFEIIPIQEHAVVVIYAENYYGNTLANLGGNATNAGDIFFVGYVDKDSIQYDYEHSEMSFDANSVTDMMKKSSGFSISVKSVPSPQKWFKLKDMDGRRALYHYLRWHTTALFIADFEFKGTDYKIQYFDSDRESMYDAVNNYMRDTLIGNVTADRQSKVWMEVDAMAYTNPTGSFTPPIMDITNRDWANSPQIDERLTNDIAYMEYGGVAYSGTVTGTFKAVIGSAPGNAPGYYGSMDTHEGLALLGQMQLNQMIGNIWANKNSPFPIVSMDLGINAQNLDIAPQETSGLHILPADTVRNIAIDGLYIPNSMSWQYHPEDYILLPNVEYAQLVNGEIGETVDIPAVEDVGGGLETPDLDLPPFPDLFPPTTSETGDDAPPRVIIHDTTYGLLMTNTFNTPNPQWFQCNGGLTQAQYQLINKIVVCPNGAIYVGYADVTSNPNLFLARAQFAGAPFVIIEDFASVSAKYGGSTNSIGVSTWNCNRKVPESVLYATAEASANIKTFLGAGATFAAKATFSLASGFADISYGQNNWLYTANGQGVLLGATANSVVSSTTIGTGNTGRHLRVQAGVGGNTVHWSDSSLGAGTAISLGRNNLSTVIRNVAEDLDANYLYIDRIESDLTGLYLMTRNNVPNPIKSSDGGYSWSTVGNLPVLADWYFACPGDAGRWIAVSSYIYYTNSFFNTYPTDKRGNLLTIAPLPALDAVKILP